MTADFVGRTVLLTGAAGGLGAETARTFIRRGATLVAVDNNGKKMAALERSAAGLGPGRLATERIDLSRSDLLRARLDDVASREGGFDVVINNAAIYPSKEFNQFTLEEYQTVQRVNVDAAVVCVQVALPAMRKKKWGRIINIASITFHGGWPLLAPYVASKGALIGLTHAWAREFGADGITANCVSPGAFPTDAERIHPDPDGYAQFVLEHQSVKRRGAPQDIAAALCFLASEEASFISGQTLNVDGGWIMAA